MRRCDMCRRVVPDNAMIFCPYDGTPLLDTVADPNAFADTIGKDSTGEESAPDPVLERAEQVAQKLAYRQRLQSLLNSEEGLQLADEEVQSLFSYVKEKIELIQQKYPELKVRFGQNDNREGVVYGQRYLVIISWQVHLANSLSDSSLQVVERKRGRLPSEFDELNRVGFDFYMNSELQIGWKERGNGRFLRTPQLGQECIDRLLHLLSKAASKDNEEGAQFF